MTDSIIVVNDGSYIVSSQSSQGIVAVDDAKVISVDTDVSTVIADGSSFVVTPPAQSAIILGGQQGIPGISAYNSATRTGFSGTEPEWVTSLQGPPGPNAAVVYAFSWGDVSPGLILTVPSGKMVFKVEIILKASFDVATTLSVGDSVDHERLFPATAFFSASVGTVQSNPGHTYSSDTPINLYITLGGGTSAGNGLILLYIQD